MSGVAVVRFVDMIIDFADLESVREKHANETIAFAGGVFDIVHVGHIEYLQRVKSLADVAVIAVSSDERVRERKGSCRPINDELARVALIDSIKYVDYSLVAPKSSADLSVPTIQIMQKLRPNLFISQDRRWFEYMDKIEASGAHLLLDPTPPRGSTTGIIQTVLDRYSATVNN